MCPDKSNLQDYFDSSWILGNVIVGFAIVKSLSFAVTVDQRAGIFPQHRYSAPPFEGCQRERLT